MSNKHLLPSYFGLGLIVISIITSQLWVFGIFLLIWIGMDLRNKQTYIFQVIRREDAPVLYWLVLCTWLFTALYYFSLF